MTLVCNLLTFNLSEGIHLAYQILFASSLLHFLPRLSFSELLADTILNTSSILLYITISHDSLGNKFNTQPKYIAYSWFKTQFCQ